MDVFCKKTLVFYINTIHDGGAERVMVNLTKCFAEDGYRVILVNSFRDTWEYEVSPLVKRVVLEPQESKENVFVKNVKRISRLRKVCKTEKADVLISFMGEPNIRAIVASIGLDIKTIISVRGNPDIEYSGVVGSVVKKILLPWADGCVFHTKYSKAMFPKKLQDKSAVIYNMINEEFYHVQTENPQYIISCGRLDKVKNYGMLIRAYAKLDIVSCPQLRIYGQGAEKENLERLIRKLDLEGRVLLCGQTQDVAGVMKSAKLFVLTSNSEGFGNVLLEAMAAGVPCIATDCPPGGPRTIFGEEHKAQLVPVGDETALVKAMKSILCDPCKCEEEKAWVKERAVEFRPDKIFERWKEYIENV